MKTQDSFESEVQSLGSLDLASLHLVWHERYEVDYNKYNVINIQEYMFSYD